MIRVFVIGLCLLWLAFGHTTNAFQQSSQKCQCIHGRELYKRTSRYTKISDIRRPTWCFSSVSQRDFEVDDRVAADEDADEDEDAKFLDQNEIETFFDEAERDANRMNFPRGKPEGYYVTNQYLVPPNGFGNLASTNSDCDEKAEGRAKGITQEEINRLGISATNITLPIALMLLDGEAFPSLSRARKSCR